MKYPFNIDQCDAFGLFQAQVLWVSKAIGLFSHRGTISVSTALSDWLLSNIFLSFVHIFNVRLLLQAASATERREVCLGHNASTVHSVSTRSS